MPNTIRHTMLRVRDLTASINFYTQCLRMQIRGKKDYPDGGAEIELTHNWDHSSKDAYVIGNGFGHIAIEVDDIMQTCTHIKQYDGSITREPGPMKYGTTVIAFAKDPDGYAIELIECKKTAA